MSRVMVLIEHRENRRLLAEPLRPRGYRIAAMVWAMGLFGILSVITVIDQAKRLAG